MKKTFRFVLLSILILTLSFIGWVYFVTYHPNEIENEQVYCKENPPILNSTQKIKILNWNVQYMASKNYIFFYDMLDGSGPDDRPSKKDIAYTLSEVARVIQHEDPDLILLQEVNIGAKNTDYKNQLTDLLLLLSPDYKCWANSFYWKAKFVPHPRIMGSVGMSLATISKFKITKALRHQLEKIPTDPLTMQFNLKRAILETYLPINNGKTYIAMNTHLDAFAQGHDTMEKQVVQVENLLKKRTQENFIWSISGDFNLLPPGIQYESLPAEFKEYYKPETELKHLYEKYTVVPNSSETNSVNRNIWFTHFPNHPEAKGPDRTIDYLFLSKEWKLGNHYVIQKGALHISDHMPIVAEIELKK